MAGWTTEVIDVLVACKRRGMEFEESWQHACTVCRPRGRDRELVSENLFEDADRDESLREFLHRVTRDAWHGYRPQQRGIALLAEGDVFPVADSFGVEQVA